MLKEFKAFIMRGNIVDLAVAFVLGVAFVTVVSTFTTVIITPLLGLVLGRSDLGNLDITLGKATLRYGLFLNSLISFVLVGFVLFLVVKVYNRFRAAADPTSKTCEFCKTDIAVDAVRCPNCTSQLQTR
jgi:large conductance mechanosensitive channel